MILFLLRYRVLLILLVPLVAACGNNSSGTSPQASATTNPAGTYLAGAFGDYLGQTPPGRAFTQFAPGIVPPDMLNSVTVSPDGQEIYWADRNRGILVTRRRDDRWTVPELASFSRSGVDFFDDAPVVSPDNTKVFFSSRRSYGSFAGNGWKFWFAERMATGWSEPQPLPEVINSTGGTHWQVSVSAAGMLYFGVESGNRFEIYRSRLSSGAYEVPKPVSEINAMGDVICPFIAPDESYIIFNTVVEGRPGGYFVSFRGSSGQWLTPERMAEFPDWESVFVTRDGRYVFSKAYWASAEIIEDRRPD